MAAPTTRRELLQAGAAAVGGFASMSLAAGASSQEETPDGGPECDGVEAREAYLFFPDRYRECARFRLVAELRVFRASVGRGFDVYLNDRRDYTAYGIRYEEDEGSARGQGSSAEDEESADEPLILAVASPDHEESPSLYDYYLTRVRFRFTESKGQFVFQHDRDEPRTQVLRTEFVRIV